MDHNNPEEVLSDFRIERELCHCDRCNEDFPIDDYNFEYDLCHKCTNDINEKMGESRYDK